MHSGRKMEHLGICLEQDVRPQKPGTWLDRYRFVHQALPEVNLEQIDLSSHFLGKNLRAPLLVSSMTGGAPPARAINRRLAAAAEELGIGMAVGSQRAAIEEPRLADTFSVRDIAPSVLLLANLGAVQLAMSYTVDHCLKAVEMIGADALILHLNPLQEALQPGGDTAFGGLLRRIEAVCRALSVPVVVKEVGCGLSGEVARQLSEAGVSALDVAGAGGTSWSEVERYRTSDPIWQRVAAQFAGWGIPTAQSLRFVRKSVPGMPLVASGGITNGIDVAKCIALGADIAGMAWPLLRPALRSSEDIIQELQVVIQTLRVAMFCVGAPDLQTLKETPHLLECDS
jgi:isopentenyl-diphosphate delta-isomerase